MYESTRLIPHDRLDADAFAPFAAEAQKRFAHVGEQLGGVQRALGDMTGMLDELAALIASDDAVREPLDDTTDAMNRLLATLETWKVQVSTPSAIAASRIAGSAVDEIHSNSLIFSQIASMTAVTAGSLGATNLVDYVVSLKSTARDLKDGALAVEGRLHEIDAAQARALTGVATASDLLRQSAGVLATGQDQRAAAAAAERRTRDSIRSMAGSMRTAAHADIKTLIGAMQFSDSFAQRMDHLGQMIRTAKQLALDDPILGVVSALIAAQSHAAAADGVQTSADARGALARISRIGRESHAEFGAEKADSPARSLAAARETALQSAIVPLQVVGPAVESAQREADRIHTAVSQAGQKFTDLRKIFDAITLSAINATLLTGRNGNGTARAALGFLAAAVQGSERVCQTSMTGCQRALLDLAAAQDAAGIGEVGRAAADFVQSVDSCREQLRATQQRIVRLGHMRSAVSDAVVLLGVAADAACVELDQIGQLSVQMRAGLPAVPDSASLAIPEGADNAVLTAIFDTYTMVREREVHIALLGSPASEAAAAAFDPATTFDDIFF
jgi:hypothetical protein